MIKYKKSKRYRVRLNTSNTHNLLVSKNSSQNFVYDKLSKYQQLRQQRLKKRLSNKNSIFFKRSILNYFPSDLSLNTLNSSFYKLEDITFTDKDSAHLNINNNNTLNQTKLFSSSPIDCSLKPSFLLAPFTKAKKCEIRNQSVQTNIDMVQMNQLCSINEKKFGLDTDNFMNFLINFYAKSQKKEEEVKVENEKKELAKSPTRVVKAPKLMPTQIFSIQQNNNLERRNDLLIDELKCALEKRNKKMNISQNN